MPPILESSACECGPFRNTRRAVFGQSSFNLQEQEAEGSSSDASRRESQLTACSPPPSQPYMLGVLNFVCGWNYLSPVHTVVKPWPIATELENTPAGW